MAMKKIRLTESELTRLVRRIVEDTERMDNIEIEDNIEDENPNVWDMYTSLETPEEVDEFVSGYLDEVLQEENQSSSLDVTDKKAVLQFLTDNGIDDDYFESMGGKEIESGGDEWLEVLSVLTGKDAYTDEFDVEDDKKISDFLITLDRLGIDFV